ncbi:MAG: homocysteine S-methyltransferase family protein [Oscillospiraceae bacterium]
MNSNFFGFDKYFILDGAMGTLLQKASENAKISPETAAITHFELVSAIHRAYIDAGSNIICTCTFSANPRTIKGSGYSLDSVICASVKAAKKACVGSDTLTALDIGPLGELIEPDGPLTFEQAYSQFCEIIELGVKYGADLIYIETMTSLIEIKAALLAAKTLSSLPVIASMSFESNGRTFTGCSVQSMAWTLEGLGADAVGINCSLGPDEIFPVAKELCESTELPVFIKANAGLPDPAGEEYKIDAEYFCCAMQKYKELGINGVGGCCGTDPSFIGLLNSSFSAGTPKRRHYKSICGICSPTRAVAVDRPLIVGERINPTGKREFQKELLCNDMSRVAALAVEQMNCGADIIDINVGVPSGDEKALMVGAVKAVQAVCSLPIIIDSTIPEVIEAGLRVCSGKALVNSVCGSEENLNAILLICKKYGAGVIGLCIDENGIPPTAEARYKIAEKITERALSFGIRHEDIFIDCLAMSVCVDQGGAFETLKAISLVKSGLGVRTILGISNISFGLPNRQSLNSSFLTLAMEHGLDLAIVNPQNKVTTDAVLAFHVLAGFDKKSKKYIESQSNLNFNESPQNTSCSSLYAALISGLQKESAEYAKAELAAKSSLSIINEILVPAMDEVGNKYERGEFFLPQLLQSASAAQSAFEVLREHTGCEVSESDKTIVVATVYGDIHDIGKNIAVSLLTNYGYNVIDLGKNVESTVIVETVKRTGAKLVGLSALMTTTVPAMQDAIVKLRESGCVCKVMVGGAVITADYAIKIGADYYAKDAKTSVDIAKEVFSAE